MQSEERKFYRQKIENLLTDNEFTKAELHLLINVAGKKHVSDLTDADKYCIRVISETINTIGGIFYNFVEDTRLLHEFSKSFWGKKLKEYIEIVSPFVYFDPYAPHEQEKTTSTTNYMLWLYYIQININRTPLVRAIKVKVDKLGAEHGAIRAANRLDIRVLGYAYHSEDIYKGTKDPADILRSPTPTLNFVANRSENEIILQNHLESSCTLSIVNDDRRNVSHYLSQSSNKDLAEQVDREVLTVHVDEMERKSKEVYEWLKRQGSGLILNVTGPTEYECPGIVEKTEQLLYEALLEVARKRDEPFIWGLDNI